MRYVAIAPCRVLDTRLPTGLFGGPAMAANSTRDFPIPSGFCGIPPNAGAYSLNVPVVPQEPLGYLTIWPTGESKPLVLTSAKLIRIMDPMELVKHGVEIAKAGAVAAGAAIPFTALIKSILGPATDEVSERVRDEARMYRFSRQITLLKKAEKLVKDAGYKPKAVPIKLLFPLLDGASLEENEDLHVMWAALLANASHDLGPALVRPSFCDLLKLMTPEVASILNAAFDYALGTIDQNAAARVDPDSEHESVPSAIEHIHSITLVDLGTHRKMYKGFFEAGTPNIAEGASGEELKRHRFAVAMDELSRMQMWTVTNTSAGEHYYFSALAAQFVTVCRRPKKKT